MKNVHQKFCTWKKGVTHKKARAIIHSRQKEWEIKLFKVREADIFVAYVTLAKHNWQGKWTLNFNPVKPAKWVKVITKILTGKLVKIETRM